MAGMLVDDKLRDVLDLVLEEYDRVTDSSRQFPLDPLRRTALVVEEAGEALKEALDLTRSWSSVTRRRLYDETIQTAATAIRMLVEMDRDLAEGR